MASRDGYFTPESVIRRIGNSPLTPFLGGGPAVLLQVAHPLVAAGVVRHSDYGRDLWRRLARTLRALYLIAYGTKAEAEKAGATVRAVHAHVHGTIDEQLGPFPAGACYSASDPALMLWVHTTLVQASLSAYTRFVGELSADEEEHYYQEMAVVAQLFGTPADVLPRSLAELRHYFTEQIESSTITVTTPRAPSRRRDPRRPATSTDARARPSAQTRDRRIAPTPPATRIQPTLEHTARTRTPARCALDENHDDTGTHGGIAIHTSPITRRLTDQEGSGRS